MSPKKKRTSDHSPPPGGTVGGVGAAYASLAGLPPIYGLYSCTVPLVMYGLFGSCGQLAVGPTAVHAMIPGTRPRRRALGVHEEYTLACIHTAYTYRILHASMKYICAFSCGLREIYLCIFHVVHVTCTCVFHAETKWKTQNEEQVNDFNFCADRKNFGKMKANLCIFPSLSLTGIFVAVCPV